MRIPLVPSLLAACGALFAQASARAQEPATPPVSEEQEQHPTNEGAEPAPESEAAPDAPRATAPSVLAIEAGTVHPVSGPPIRNGIVVIQGDRIVAVGVRGEVEVPAGATVQSFPTGHVYPGLVDALTDAFTDRAVHTDGGLDAGDAIADALRPNHDRSDRLVDAGITTAYVASPSPALVRGQGAIVRPTRDGFVVWQGRENAAVELRLTAGPTRSHPLQRQQQFEQASSLFDLEAWNKARTEHEEALKKYEKEFGEYLAFHKKKKDAQKKDDAKPQDEKAGEAPAGGEAGAAGSAESEGERPRRRRRPTPPGDEPKQSDADALAAEVLRWFATPAQDPPKQDPKPQDGKPAEGKEGEKPAEKGGEPEKKDDGPKRPTYPKAPPRDLQKETLQRVLDGELTLRVEAHRADELRAALRLRRERHIPSLVIERGYAADAVADELAKQGVPTVLTEVLPVPLPEIYEDFDPAALPARLQAHGAPFAIASGTARRAAALPLMAATAIGRGLAEDAALRAITLTPAEVLGIAKETGSLQSGKFADVLVCDRSLFASDSRVLLVLSKGSPEYEAR
jgi:imidazolonepropionase-like amidohydrolase